MSWRSSRRSTRQRACSSKPSRRTQLLLYYGNPQAAAPRYDLSLVAGQLLAADQAEAALAAEEQLKTSWGEGHHAGQGGVVFWGILAVVVVVLLVIISRLLPQSVRPESETSADRPEDPK